MCYGRSTSDLRVIGAVHFSVKCFKPRPPFMFTMPVAMHIWLTTSWVEEVEVMLGEGEHPEYGLWGLIALHGDNKGAPCVTYD